MKFKIKMDKPIYKGSYPALMKRLGRKQAPLQGAFNFIPPANCDFDAIQDKITPPPATETPDMTIAQRRRAEYQKEFQGESELYSLHAMLIATLRRRDPPPQTSQLFFRLWREKGQWLADTVRMRWRISAATTFADHGENGDQRALGMGLSVLFDSIKLHESERRASGQPPIEPFDLPKGRIKTKLAFESHPYSFKNGDLDRNLVTRLWALSEKDDVIRPLAQSMLNEIMLDQRTTFARVQKIKIHFR